MVPKFRAWLKDEKEMQNVLAFDTRGHSFLGIEGPHVTVDGWCDNFEVGKQAVLMQSTGLKDKNGVEIYCGDIGWDEHLEEYGKVVFENGSFTYEWKNISEDLFEATDDIEIVGNIYKNPDLLEQADES
ncbi:MAG: YopX family protein [Enterococcus gallinarum]|nr:YopX family protein [Enterococcus gallinarum]MDY4070984.1 YopX family protein [Enterococcus gallinarum]